MYYIPVPYRGFRLTIRSLMDTSKSAACNNTQKYPSKNTPSKDFLRIGFQRSQKHAGEYEERASQVQIHVISPQGKIKNLRVLLSTPLFGRVLPNP